jgi:hypothetical protein
MKKQSLSNKIEWATLLSIRKSKVERVLRQYPVSKYDFLIVIKEIPEMNNNIMFNDINLHYEAYLKLFNDGLKFMPSLTKFGIYSQTQKKIEYWLSRYHTYEYGTLRISELASTGVTFLKKKGLSDDEIRIEMIGRHQKEKLTRIKNGTVGYHTLCPIDLEYWTNTGLSIKESKMMVSNEQTRRSIKAVKTRILNDNYKYNSTKLEYYTEYLGMSKISAYTALSDRQRTFSYDICIEKYGTEQGIKVFNDRQKKWRSTLDGKPEHERIAIEKRRLSNSTKFYSKESIVFFKKVIDIFNFDEATIKWKANELFIYDKEKKKINFYDFYIPELNLIIEYHGVRWHPSQNELSEDEFKKWRDPFKKLSAEDAEARDKYKKELAIENKYKIVEVYSDWDFRKKIELINEIIN